MRSVERQRRAESCRNVPFNPQAAVLMGRLNRGVFDRRMHGHRLGAKHVITAFARQCRGAAARRLIKIKAVELLLSRRCDREVAIRPAIGCCEDFFENRVAISSGCIRTRRRNRAAPECGAATTGGTRRAHTTRGLKRMRRADDEVSFCCDSLSACLLCDPYNSGENGCLTLPKKSVTPR